MSVKIKAICWCALLGAFGAHHFYLGNLKRAIAYWFMWVFGAAAANAEAEFAASVDWVYTLIGVIVLVWWPADLIWLVTRKTVVRHGIKET